jgi:hypothetical protein
MSPVSRLVGMEATSSGFNGTRDPSAAASVVCKRLEGREKAQISRESRAGRRTLQREEAERSDLLRVAACVLRARVGTVASAWSYGEETAGLAGMPVEMVVRLGAVRKPFLHLPFHLIFVFIPRQTNEEGPSIHSRFPDAPSNGAGHAQTPTRIVPPRQPRPSLHLDNDKKSCWCWLKKTTTTPLLSHCDSLSFTSQPREKKLRDIPK